MLNGISQIDESQSQQPVYVTGTQTAWPRDHRVPVTPELPPCIPPHGKEEPTLTPWGRCLQCLRRSLVWLGWHSGCSRTCHTISPGNKKSLWGSVNSRRPRNPATWWSKHSVSKRKRWHHHNTKAARPGLEWLKNPWQSNIRFLC